MKNVLVVKDHDLEISSILENAKRDTLKLNPKLNFLSGPRVETDKCEWWPGDKSKEYAKKLREEFPNSEYPLVTLLLNKALREYSPCTLDGGPVFGYCHKEEGVLVVSDREWSDRSVPDEKIYPTFMYLIGLSEGLEPHDNNPRCFMSNYTHNKEIPSEYCSECLSKVKHKNF